MTGEPIVRTVATLAARSSRMGNWISSLQGRTSMMQNRTESLRGRCQAFDVRFDAQNKRFSWIDTRLDSADSRMFELTERMDSLTGKVLEAEQSGKDEDQERDQFQYRLKKLEAKFDTLQSAIDEQKRMTAAAEARRETAEASIVSLQQQVMTYEERLSAAMALTVVGLVMMSIVLRGGRFP